MSKEIDRDGDKGLVGLSPAMAERLLAVVAARDDLSIGADAEGTEPPAPTARFVVVEHRQGEIASSRVLVVAPDRGRMDPELIVRELSRGDGALLLVGSAGAIPATAGALVTVVDDDCSPSALESALDGLFDRVELRRDGQASVRHLERYRYELGELVQIARAISLERDIDRLLGLILEKSRFITGADAGSIYVVEGQQPTVAQRVLHFKLSQNESCAFESSEFTVPVSTRSIAGAAVVSRRAISIPDVYSIPADAPYGFDRSFDEKVGYRTCSMISVPMISAEDEVIGVIQLINKKRIPGGRLHTLSDFDGNVMPFGERDEELLLSLASQAGIALENAMLYDEIRRIFEGFVRASVQAIEQRDPTTSGHSLRVSVLSCRLAEVVDGAVDGPFAAAKFNRREMKELEYAALLHDFGKIGVREKVLVKAKKLYPEELEAIRARFDYVSKQIETEILERKMRAIESRADAAELAAIEGDLIRRQAELDGMWMVILQANEPTVLMEGDFTRVGELGALRYCDPRGRERPMLTAEEVACLQVTKGSLNREEIDEIRSHVDHTFAFLSRIPWGKSFERIPAIAGAHHEKLNGTGYPSKLQTDEIPLQSKIMTIADIYDALTARDRPYKKAIPVERALDILGFEVKDGNIDRDLVAIFRDAQVFHAVDQDLQY